MDDNLCVICNELVYEDRLHLFFNYNFSRRVWNYISIDWSKGSEIQQCIQHARSRFKHPFFFEYMLTAAWNIWILRNGRTFRGENATFAAWRCNFVHDLTLLAHRMRVNIRDKLYAWINSLTQLQVGSQILFFLPFISCFLLQLVQLLLLYLIKGCGALLYSKYSKKT